MANLAAAERFSGTIGEPPANQPRTVRRRHSLPSGRAVVGGFLIAVSALGLFTAYSQAAAGPTTMFVVARRDVPVGTRLAPTDLTRLAMDLPDAVAAGLFREAAGLAGATTVGPIRRGELIQAGDVVRKRSGPEELEVSFAIETSRAVAGTLKPGERIDVLATFGGGGDSYTVAVVRQARVLDVQSDRTPLAGQATAVLRVAVATAQEALALTHAVNAGDVTVVRATGTTVSGAAGQTYRAPASPDGTATTAAP